MIFKTPWKVLGLVKVLAHFTPQLRNSPCFSLFPSTNDHCFRYSYRISRRGDGFSSFVGFSPEGTPALPYILIMMAANGIAQTNSPSTCGMVVGNEYFGASLGKVLQMSLVPQGFRLILTFLLPGSCLSIGTSDQGRFGDSTEDDREGSSFKVRSLSKRGNESNKRNKKEERRRFWPRDKGIEIASSQDAFFPKAFRRFESSPSPCYRYVEFSGKRPTLTSLRKPSVPSVSPPPGSIFLHKFCRKKPERFQECH